MAVSNNSRLEKLMASILIKYIGNKEREGRAIKYIYSREGFNELNIKRETVDDSQFISIGDILTLEGHECKVVDINFKMFESLYEMNNTTSIDQPMSHNCQIGVFVQRLNPTT